MIQPIPITCPELLALELKDHIEKDSRNGQVLKEFRKLFTEPTQLPPSRGVFDHRIIL